MAELGYSVEWQVLNSKDFGVPQHRQRVFIVGHLGNGSGRKVFPVGSYSAEVVELQGQRDGSRVISNTLSAGDRNSAGTYVADRQTDRQTDVPQGQWIPQGMNVGRSDTVKPVRTNIAHPICARDYKGPRNREHGTVVFYEQNHIDR